MRAIRKPLGKRGVFFSLCVTILMLSAAGGAWADDHAARADAILESVGRPVGLVHLPRCGEGELALALLEADDRLRVHGQDTDYAAVQAARRTARVVRSRRAWPAPARGEQLRPGRDGRPGRGRPD